MLLHRLLADAVLAFHAAFVLFVVLGLLLILIGLALRWGWVRNFWFRTLHLLAILIVVVQAWSGVSCPLTILEKTLRTKGGEQTYPGGFMAFWVQRIVFWEAEPWVFTALYTIVGGLVLATFILGRPRCPWAGPFRKGLASRESN